MIRILADLYGVSQPPDGAQQIASAADYVAARRAVRAALDQQHDLTLYVTDIVAAQWLSDLKRYPAAVITWRDLRPETTFEQLFGTPPPPLLSADLLVALELETITPPPGNVPDPVAYILGQRLGELWAYTDAPAGHFAQIVRWAATQRDWQPGALLALLDAHLRRWARGDTRFAALQAAQLSANARQILTRSALARYDTAWQHAQPWGTMPTIALDGVEPLAIEALPSLHTQLSSYWNQRFALNDRSSKTIELALNQVSGLSLAELDALAWMLDQHPAQLTAALLAKIELCFVHLPEARDRLSQLRHLVAPPVPVLPDAGWQDGRWLRWTIDEYMPYFGWIIRTNLPRDHQIVCAEAFGDWVYERYPHWCNDDDSPLARHQHSLLRELLERDPQAAVFWVVLDGMAWWHGEMARPLCEQHGLYTQEYLPAIAALPSITRIAKRALVTGVSTTDIEQPTIRAAAVAHFARIGLPARITYRMREALDALRAGDLRCVIVLDNVIDEAAHSRREFTDTQGIRGHLEEIAAALGQARAICASQGRRLHVLIGSDHGGTLLPDTARALPLPRSVKPIEEIWEDETPPAEAQKHSPRAATVDDIAHLAPQERAHWYVLDRDQFQLERHYLAPRGYAYLKPRPSGWTHGGLTPEELIVPLLHLAPELPQVVSPQITFEGSLYPNQASELSVMLVNTNRFALEQLRVTIDDIEYIQSAALEAAGSAQMVITLPAATGTAAEVALAWRIDYRAFGVAYMHAGKSIVAVRRLSVESSEFDDMFDDL
jgi:hypothetical protein